MSYTNQVVVGPEFFKNAFKDYANWHWALVREFMQNSIDCGSKTIRVTVDFFEGTTKVTVGNNGIPMTLDIVNNKLLALGGSNKNFNNTVGGFGKAKEILYFAHNLYKINTGNIIIEGSGAGYNISEGEYFDGTISQIDIDGDHKGRLIKEFRKFASHCQWSGEFWLDGHRVDTNLKKGAPRREFEFGTVYTNNSFKNIMIVRMNGIPMFNTYTTLDKCVIVELKGPSSQVLTANRDYLTADHSYTMHNFLAELNIDKRSALKDNKTSYKVIAGKKIGHHIESTSAPLPVSQNIVNILVDRVRSQITEAELSYYDDTAEIVENRVGQEFVIKNETGLKIPSYYDPTSSEFSQYSLKIAKMWGNILLELHRLFDVSGSFTIGFIFSDDIIAQFQNDQQFNRVYYINPAVVTRQHASNSQSFKKRFKLTDRNQLIALALHEFVHAIGFLVHDENYTSKFTEMMPVVMDNRSRFNWCFSQSDAIINV